MKTPLLLAACLLALGACAANRSSEAPASASAEPAPAPAAKIICQLRAQPAAAPKANAAASSAPTKPGSKAASSAKTTAKPAAKAAASSAARPAPAAAPQPAQVVPDADGKCPAGYDAVQQAAQAAASSAKATEAKSADKSEGRTVKSPDGKIEGTVYGTPARGSKLEKIQIGMTRMEVRKLIGAPDDERAYVTGKAFIPFYFGSDSVRQEWVYQGAGSIAFDAGPFGGGGVVMMINHDPAIR